MDGMGCHVFYDWNGAWMTIPATEIPHNRWDNSLRGFPNWQNGKMSLPKMLGCRGCDSTKNMVLPTSKIQRIHHKNVRV